MLFAAALEGRLFRYRTSPAPLQAFESPVDHAHPRYVIYVGGLTDGLLACPYVEELATFCDEKGWAFVQPVLSSSYSQYGMSSLANDANELSDCLQYLVDHREATAFAIVGHSTGCQDAVTLMATAPPSLRALVRAVVLQAPVSDREAWSLEPEPEARAALLDEALALVGEGRGRTILRELHYGFVPMSAQRYVDLFSTGGADDFFSSDFDDDTLSRRLGHMGTDGQRNAAGMATEPVPSHAGLLTLFVHSVGEEYVPRSVDVPALSSRFVAAAGDGARALLIDGATHNLSSPPEARQAFIAAVGSLLDDAIERVFKTDVDF